MPARGPPVPQLTRSAGQVPRPPHRPHPHPPGSAIGSQSRVMSASVLPLNATVDPLEVQVLSEARRPPTLRECQTIIRHLQRVNDKQAHEVGIG